MSVRAGRLRALDYCILSGASVPDSATGPQRTFVIVSDTQLVVQITSVPSKIPKVENYDFYVKSNECVDCDECCHMIYVYICVVSSNLV